MRLCASVVAFTAFILFANAAPIADTADDAAWDPRTTLSAYGTGSCTALRSVNTVPKGGSCSKLWSPSRSIKFDGAVPSGCTVFGYDSTNCSGDQLFSVRGPTTRDTCYQTSSQGGVDLQIQSVDMIC